MKILIDPSPRKLSKFLDAEDLQGKTFLHHTGSMFGIGCRVSDTQAIQRIINLKQKEDRSGLIALVPDIRWLEDNEIDIPDRLRPLLDQYWPGNLTVVFACDDPRFEAISVNGKVAFRVPDNDLLRMMVDMIGEPIVSTSINRASLPAENDLDKLKSFYASWFDYAIHPHPRNLTKDPRSSTIIEYVSSNEPGNTEGVTNLKCLREGSIPFYGIQNSFAMPTITFVCTANICRSPMAEKLFNYYAKQRGLRMAGDSCGLIEGGRMISLNSMQLLMEKGIEEAKDHVSKQITPDIVKHSWLLLTMEQRHRDFIRKQEPSMAHKVLTLNEIMGGEGDIEDPYGSGLDDYRETFAIIEERITGLIDKIENKQIDLYRQEQ